MTHEEMIDMLRAISRYLEIKDESPLASTDLYRVIPELERLWKLEESVSHGNEVVFKIEISMNTENKVWKRIRFGNLHSGQEFSHRKGDFRMFVNDGFYGAYPAYYEDMDGANLPTWAYVQPEFDDMVWVLVDKEK